ncbi:MAG: GNAT family N-acetyltransferase [Waddliaceae bacterium]|jgi:RimJ/RimL family protein N-acetyltransferase|nr:GNAT family N-acetyltransferase [Waddliaceae bacterium]MBT3579497.1 GNAT family N-acetyltransferase [Waddliaceae bacterium]MBT4444646.1 GNAT family N-acetyltransferase [Waddliaceae bacterium]MBT6929211.1 GNAT family N-acetyltransferase [Waddliaceae bacterium]MBT7264774.1 GNAT family N-acetyltransferase [Waddliaceae bacterium]
MRYEEKDGDSSVTLRSLRRSDAKDVYDNINDKDIVLWTSNIPYPYPKDGAEKWIAKAHREMKSEKSYAFAIAFDDKLIGVISLMNVDKKNQKAEIGYWLGKKFWGRGFMTEAVAKVLEFGFQTLKLHRIDASLYSGNIASQKVLMKSGFVLEGTLRESKKIDNKYHDELWFGILNP